MVEIATKAAVMPNTGNPVNPPQAGSDPTKLAGSQRVVNAPFAIQTNQSREPWLKELIYGRHGTGKAQPLDALVLTPAGFVPMGNITSDSEVITPSGRVAKVIRVFPQGVKKVYRITLNDGSSTECCVEHLWRVASHRTRMNRASNPYDLLSTADIQKELQKEEFRARKVQLPQVSPIDFAVHSSTKLPLDPYLLGLLIGDGGLTQHPTITTADEEIRQAFIADGWQLSFNNECGKATSWSIAQIKPVLEQIGVYGKKSLDKSIPKEYLYHTAATRLALLQGLMDTDGTVQKTHGRNGNTSGSAVFNTSSKQLAQDVVWIVRSLGGRASIAERTAPVRTGTGQLAYNVAIKLHESMSPFRLARKCTDLALGKTLAPTRTIVSIEYVREAVCQCILLDDPEHLYLTDDFIVTHNTELAGTSVDVEQMRDVLLIDAEKGNLTLFDSPRIKNPNLIDRIEVSSFKQVAQIQEFLKAHCKFRDNNDLDKLKALQSQVTGVPIEEIDRVRQYRTVIIDSLTEIESYCTYSILGIDPLKLDGEIIDTAGWPEFRKNHEMMKLVVRGYRDLPMNVIFLCPESFTQDEQKRMHYTPQMTGKLSDQVQGFVDIVGWLVTGQGTEDKPAPRRMWVQQISGPGIPRYDAKNRRPIYQQPYFDEPNHAKIMKGIGLLK